MAESNYVPFIPSLNNYRLGVVFGTVRFYFLTRWNARDNAWYFDLLAEDDSVILVGVKVVLGGPLCRRSSHVWFRTNVLRVIDTSGSGRDADYDDLGGRVQVLHQSLDAAMLPLPGTT